MEMIVLREAAHVQYMQRSTSTANDSAEFHCTPFIIVHRDSRYMENLQLGLLHVTGCDISSL